MALGDGWTMDDVETIVDGGQMGIYDGWICAYLKDGRLVNRWAEDDYRFQRTEEYIKACGNYA